MRSRAEFVGIRGLVVVDGVVVDLPAKSERERGAKERGDDGRRRINAEDRHGVEE